MLLPWAGLGWLVGLTMGAATRTRWRDAALAALVVVSVGAVNATALADDRPGPLLWLLVRRARAAGDVAAGACAALRDRRCSSLGVSLWWIGDGRASRAARAPTSSPTPSRWSRSASRRRRPRCGAASATG